MEKAFGHLNTYFSRLKACLCFPIFQEFHETRFSEFKGFKKKGLSLKDSLIFIWKDESTKRKSFFPLGPIFRGFLVQTCTVIEKMFRTLSIYEAKENPRNLPFSAKGINPNENGILTIFCRIQAITLLIFPQRNAHKLSKNEHQNCFINCKFTNHFLNECSLRDMTTKLKLYYRERPVEQALYQKD